MEISEPNTNQIFIYNFISNRKLVNFDINSIFEPKLERTSSELFGE
jgi:hypothetical protein